MRFNYKVWSDSESEVSIKSDYFFTLEDACNFACETAHKYDGKQLAILHVEELREGDTICTYESLIEGVNC